MQMDGAGRHPNVDRIDYPRLSAVILEEIVVARDTVLAHAIVRSTTAIDGIVWCGQVSERRSPRLSPLVCGSSRGNRGCQGRGFGPTPPKPAVVPVQLRSLSGMRTSWSRGRSRGTRRIPDSTRTWRGMCEGLASGRVRASAGLVRQPSPEIFCFELAGEPADTS